MSDTTNLALPLLEAAQAQKHVTHNEALSRLDALVQLAVLSRTLTTPPATPAEGDRYLVASGATGDWAGHAGHVAYRFGGAWSFATPKPGWRAWVSAENTLLLFDGTSWAALQGGGGAAPQTLPLLGINTTADATNKFAVASSDVLMTHAGNDLRLKLNKNAAAATASLLYQSNWSGRAEFGLTGDDNFHIKVSADGASWNEALVIDRTTGKATLAAGSVTNTALAAMPAATLKGRLPGSSGAPADLTAAQAAQVLSLWGRIAASPFIQP